MTDTTNKYRNEKIIKIGPNEILLRPDFENIHLIEENVGGLAWLSYKVASVKTKEDLLKNMLKMTEVAKIIFYAQVRDKEEKRKYNLAEIFDMINAHGYFKLIPQLNEFISLIAAGSDNVEKELEKNEEKKDSEVAEEKKT
jgi:hypothetical protein